MKKFNDPPWHPIANPVHLKHLGKLGEETGELSRIISRAIIQGLNGIDPESGEPNHINMEKEMADVIAGIELCCEHFGLAVDPLRVTRKKESQRLWHKDA